MQTFTILHIIVALFLSFSLAFYQYFYKEKYIFKIQFLLFCLKSTSFFLLFLLFINPKINKIELQNNKPNLLVLVDNSKSIAFFKEEKQIKNFVESINNNKEVSQKFVIKNYSFGSNVTILDSLVFNKTQTNIHNAISSIGNVNVGTNSAIVLLTDGNQTTGKEYEFNNYKQVIFPIVFGDTIKHKDLIINKLNVNKYSYVQNKFPVEVLINYQGKGAVKTHFSILNNGKVVFSKKLSLSSEDNSKTIRTNLQSTKKGIHNYTSIIHAIAGEKNIENNSKSFSVEVIDQQTKVALITSVLHPDLGAIKKSIETNKERSVDVFLIDNFKNQLNDYQLVILYQPNRKFNTVISNIIQNNKNYFLVSGSNTDWNFINTLQLGFTKNVINQVENYGATYQNNFLPFSQKNIGFSDFPPLTDLFGKIKLHEEHQNLLAQNSYGLQTQQPLLVTFEKYKQKKGVLFGEGIWKWRAASFLANNSFQDFDEFTANLIQYLAFTTKRNRLEVTTDILYPANSTIFIAALYTDKNYRFDARANLEITITNQETKKIQKFPFSLADNSYQVAIDNISSGNYMYKVSVTDENIHKSGSFSVSEYQIEEQFTNANDKKLLTLANKTGGKLFYKNQWNALKKELLENTSFYTTQKELKKQQQLIDFKWILFGVIGLFTIEWFVRKYVGKI